jgi:hypothetical protein
MKLTYAASIAKIEAELQVVVTELAKQHRRAAEAETSSFRIMDAGARNPPGIGRVALAAAIAALIVWAICFTTLAVVSARDTLAPAESLVTVIENAASSLESDLRRAWQMTPAAAARSTR